MVLAVGAVFRAANVLNEANIRDGLEVFERSPSASRGTLSAGFANIMSADFLSDHSQRPWAVRARVAQRDSFPIWRTPTSQNPSQAGPARLPPVKLDQYLTGTSIYTCASGTASLLKFDRDFELFV